MADKNVPSRSNWSFGITDAIIEDKKLLRDSYLRYMFLRTNRIFKYTGLPDTIPERDLEMLLQVGSFAFITKLNKEEAKGENSDGLYAFYGGLGGIPNPYYQPTKAIITNPSLRFCDTLDIDKEGVLIRNDSAHIGLLPLIERYADLLTECDISLRFGLINTRIITLLVADDDNTKVSSEAFIEDIVQGKKIGVITGSSFMEGLKSVEYQRATTSQLQQIKELRQYLWASWFNEIGLQANFNMKREATNEAEAGMNEDALSPLIDDMLINRQEGIDKVNALYGTNIKVELRGVWERKKILEELKLEQEKAEVKKTEQEGEKTDKESSPEGDKTDKEKEA